jgi:hypothetical protein
MQEKKLHSNRVINVKLTTVKDTKTEQKVVQMSSKTLAEKDQAPPSGNKNNIKIIP